MPGLRGRSAHRSRPYNFGAALLYFTLKDHNVKLRSRRPGHGPYAQRMGPFSRLDDSDKAAKKTGEAPTLV